jgi:hypothetical protein
MFRVIDAPYELTEPSAQPNSPANCPGCNRWPPVTCACCDAPVAIITQASTECIISWCFRCFTLLQEIRSPVTTLKAWPIAEYAQRLADPAHREKVRPQCGSNAPATLWDDVPSIAKGA